MAFIKTLPKYFNNFKGKDVWCCLLPKKLCWLCPSSQLFQNEFWSFHRKSTHRLKLHLNGRFYWNSFVDSFPSCTKSWFDFRIFTLSRSFVPFSSEINWIHSQGLFAASLWKTVRNKKEANWFSFFSLVHWNSIKLWASCQNRLREVMRQNEWKVLWVFVERWTERERNSERI